MLTLENISHSYGSQVLFRGVDALVHPRDRIGLVGANGAGKTTLLRIIIGLETPIEGRVAKARWVTTGYLPQEGLATAGRTLYAEVESACADIPALRTRLEAATARLRELATDSGEYRELLFLIGGWEHQMENLEAEKLRSRIERILLGLGFALSDLDRDCAEFSGGWQMRIALAKLLLQQPSLLLLDEPTNHLDLDSLRWLETFLQNYEGAILLVSHDRAFLDSLTTRTFALHHGRLEIYAGNYSYYEEESLARREQQANAYAAQQREIQKTVRFIERFRYQASKAAQVQSRLKMLAKAELIEAPEREADSIAFRFPPAPRSGRTVLSLRRVRKAYGQLLLFDNLDLEIERGERIAIVGPNGAGKSTLARLLAGVEPPDAGQRILGHNVMLSYFAQHQAEELDPDRDVLDNAADGQPLEVRQKLRGLLGTFLFTGDAVFKKTAVLSGGEKSRLALAKMLLRSNNCLILDEPTNHLDIRSKLVLQQAILDFDGTLLIVSHDRDFLAPLVTKVIEVRPQRLRQFPGSLEDYLQKIEAEEKLAPVRAGVVRAASVDNPRERRRRDAELRQKLAPLKKRAAQLEEEIQILETCIQARETAMLDPTFFKRGEKTTQEVQEYEKWKAALEVSFLEWERTLADLDRAEREFAQG